MHYDKKFAELTLNEIIAIHLDLGGGPSFTTDYLVESTLRVLGDEEVENCRACWHEKFVGRAALTGRSSHE